jgi:hypothetical protein
MASFGLNKTYWIYLVLKWTVFDSTLRLVSDLAKRNQHYRKKLLFFFYMRDVWTYMLLISLLRNLKIITFSKMINEMQHSDFMADKKYLKAIRMKNKF